MPDFSTGFFMANKRVLFIYHGGTIGQVPEDRDGQMVLVPPKDSSLFKSACDIVLKDFEKTLDVTFEIMTTKDSTNMTPNDWEKLVFRIKKAQDEENYGAVGIAHGTDTLAYTATALALALHGKTPEKSGLRIPVCITGAQNPIYYKFGDGEFNLANLFRTIELAVDEGVADVLVNFWNRVLLGCRSLKTNESDFDAFKSPAFPDVGHIDGNGVHLKTHYLKKKKDALSKLEISPKFGRGVVIFELTPGLDPNLLLGFVANGGVNAIILKSLGEGNVCNEGPFNLLPFIKQATQEYITPIFIATKFIGGNATSVHYEVGFEAIKAGAIACYNHTDVAAEVKVKWLLGNNLCSGIEEFRKAMQTNYAGEVNLTHVH